MLPSFFSCKALPILKLVKFLIFFITFHLKDSHYFLELSLNNHQCFPKYQTTMRAAGYYDRNFYDFLYSIFPPF